MRLTLPRSLILSALCATLARAEWRNESTGAWQVARPTLGATGVVPRDVLLRAGWYEYPRIAVDSNIIVIAWQPDPDHKRVAVPLTWTTTAQAKAVAVAAQADQTDKTLALMRALRERIEGIVAAINAGRKPAAWTEEQYRKAWTNELGQLPSISVEALR
jgi:hypothetical protein